MHMRLSLSLELRWSGSSNLDFLHPAEDVQHFLEDFVQVVGELKAHAAGTQQLQQVVPQSQHIILSVTRKIGTKWKISW